MACAPLEDSDQTGHSPSLIRVFAYTQWVAQDPSSLQADSDDWSNWADAQADLSLRWAHTPFCRFSHALAHLSMLKGNNHFSDQEDTQDLSVCITYEIVSLSTGPSILYPANSLMMLLIPSRMLSIYIRNSTGPRTLPCRIPFETSGHSEDCEFTSTCWLQLSTKLSIQLYTCPSIPYAWIIFKNFLWGTLSKAFWKSKYVTSTGFPSSILLVKCPITSNSWCWK